MKFFIQEVQRFDLFTRANSIAYSFFLSLFPSLIALFTLIPWLKRTFLHYLPEGENFDHFLQNEIQKIMPGDAGKQLFGFIEDITNNPRIALLSIGFVSAIYFSSNGILSLLRSFDKTYEDFAKWNSWKMRWVAILLTFQLSGLLIASVILVILGQSFIKTINNWLNLSFLAEQSLNMVRWLAIIALYYVSIALIYRNGAAMIRKFKFFTPGAALASTLCLLSSVIFSMYVDMFNTYNRLYGSIGAIIVLMLWIQMNVMSILIGFELNASIVINKRILGMTEKIKESSQQLEAEEDHYGGA
ncbi:MAG TPA: YihY/virulence factor BrkB family protein [Haliscomenobacter sp.]|uniref:YihY/virulence factor BrkB family protein n=1 Tax=Haliscomenobacter sp. TaxID=2717303 RepID=UPI002CCA2B14|nr:YihY/virulence factor BrkB family protein [Haliscomenobacter sp.]HOY18979.1 YihY/virulence factor BrkB family protein [Haliscomenobacter sp.]HPH17460.1 YihY/virulence factor BrkB family protein [Haliscomenobacter sp.]